MTVLYGASALAGGRGVLFLFASLLEATTVLAGTGVGLALLAATALFAFAIAVFKDDDVQLWLGRCVFGNDEDKYPDNAVDEAIEAGKLREILGLEAA